MKTRHAWFAGIAVLAALAACGKSEQPDATHADDATDGAAAVAKLRGLRDAMCACRDIACSGRIMDDKATTRWLHELSAHPPLEHADEVLDLSGQMLDCASKQADAALKAVAPAK